MLNLLRRPVVLSLLIHSALAIGVTAVASTKPPTEVELYVVQDEDVSEAPKALPASTPPLPEGFENLAQIRSGPKPSPTPSALEVCKELIAKKNVKKALRKKNHFKNHASVLHSN